MFVIAQIISAAAVVLALVSVLCKDKGRFLQFQALKSMCCVVVYYLLKGYTGVCTGVIGVIQCLFSEDVFCKWVVLGLYGVTLGICMKLDVIGVFTVVGSAIYSLTLLKSDDYLKIKSSLAVCGLIKLVYDFSTKGYILLVTDCLTLFVALQEVAVETGKSKSRSFRLILQGRKKKKRKIAGLIEDKHPETTDKYSEFAKEELDIELPEMNESLQETDGILIEDVETEEIEIPGLDEKSVSGFSDTDFDDIYDDDEEDF